MITYDTNPNSEVFFEQWKHLEINFFYPVFIENITGNENKNLYTHRRNVLPLTKGIATLIGRIKVYIYRREKTLIHPIEE